MRKTFLLMSLSLSIMLTACSSEEGNEIIDYHNDFIDEVISKTEVIKNAYSEIEYVEDDKAVEVLKKEIPPVLEDIKKYMDAQKPKKEDTKAYHQLRLKEINYYIDLIKYETNALSDYIEDEITEAEFDEFLEALQVKYDEYELLTIEANEKIEELSEKYSLEDIED